MASVPHRKALQHFKHFAELVARFKDNVEYVRTLARAAFRSSDPIATARCFIRDHDAIVDELSRAGAEPDIAHTLAGIASLGADPLNAAVTLLQHFEDVVRLARRTHPSVARSIALSACRATDPLSVARSYMENYDSVVRVISRTDPECARAVAAQVFRSNDPMRWARRYLAELKGTTVREVRTTAADRRSGTS